MKEDQLVFIACQPRSGSTLLQHILGAHTEVHTLPEPWFMLPLAYMSRSAGTDAEYNAEYAYLALRDFLKRIPDGEETFLSAQREMALSLYQAALQPSGKRIFVDKTPRYYLILPELARLFPKARFVVLLRNPLSVLTSILESTYHGEWLNLFQEDRKHDLITAPRLLLDAIEKLGPQGHVLHYEELVDHPETSIRNLCRHIGIPFEGEMLNYADKVKFENTTFLDPKSIYRHTSPVDVYKNGWMKTITSSTRKHIAQAYLNILGEDLLARLGYSYSELMRTLSEIPVTSWDPWSSGKPKISSSWELSWWDRKSCKISRSVRRFASRVGNGR